jgi:hypothetical protein
MVFLGRKSNTLRLGAFAGESPNSKRVISRKERKGCRGKIRERKGGGGLCVLGALARVIILPTP